MSSDGETKIYDRCLVPSIHICLLAQLNPDATANKHRLSLVLLLLILVARMDRVWVSTLLHRFKLSNKRPKLKSINSNWIIDSRCKAEKSYLGVLNSRRWSAGVFLSFMMAQCSPATPAFEGQYFRLFLMFSVQWNQSRKITFLFASLLERRCPVTHMLLSIATAITISIASGNGYQFSLSLCPRKGAF